MNTNAEQIKDLIEEAEFQLLAHIDICNWVAAIARAIARDVDTGGGADVPVLTDLVKYFDDSGGATLDTAFEQFKKIATLVPAPRSAQLENVARIPVGLEASLADRVLLARESAGLSQADLAKLVGARQASISQIESGKTKRTSYLAEIARACLVDIHWLAFGLEGGQ